MPRQPWSAAVKSDRRSGYIPCPLRGKGLGKSGGALLTKEGRGGWEKCQAYSIAVTSLALLERAMAWEWVKDPLSERGTGESKKNIKVLDLHTENAKI